MQNKPQKIYRKVLTGVAVLGTFLVLPCSAMLEQSPETPHMQYTPSLPTTSGHLAPWMRRILHQHQQQADAWDRYEMTGICATTCFSLQELYLYAQSNAQASPHDMAPYACASTLCACIALWSHIQAQKERSYTRMREKGHKNLQKNAGVKQKIDANTIILSPASPSTARRTGIANPITGSAQQSSQAGESSDDLASSCAASS